MLVLGVKIGEEVYVDNGETGERLAIKVFLHPQHSAIRLGFNAPSHYRILRAELVDPDERSYVAKAAHPMKTMELHAELKMLREYKRSMQAEINKWRGKTFSTDVDGLAELSDKFGA